MIVPGWHEFPKCPNCGLEAEDWAETGCFGDDGDTAVIECPGCQTDYRVTMQMSALFLSEKEGA